MATTVRVTVNRSGIRQLARGAEMQAEMLRRAKRVAAQAQATIDPRQAWRIEASVVAGRNRAHASVIWPGGLRQEIEDRILGRAMDAAGDGGGVSIVHREA